MLKNKYKYDYIWAFIYKFNYIIVILFSKKNNIVEIIA